MNRHEWNRKIHGVGRTADLTTTSTPSARFCKSRQRSDGQRESRDHAHAVAFDAAYEELLENDTLSGARLCDFEMRPAETGEDAVRRRARRTRRAKRVVLGGEHLRRRHAARAASTPSKHAVEKYYPRPPRFPTTATVFFAPTARTTLMLSFVDYMPELKKSSTSGSASDGGAVVAQIAHARELSPRTRALAEGVQALHEGGADERLAELRDELIPALEAVTAGARFAGMPSETDVTQGAVRLGHRLSEAEAETETERMSRKTKRLSRDGAHQKPGAEGVRRAERRNSRRTARRWSVDGIDGPPRGTVARPERRGICRLWRNTRSRRATRSSCGSSSAPDEGTGVKLFRRRRVRAAGTS